MRRHTIFGYNGAQCTIDAVRVVRSWISCTNNRIDARSIVVLLAILLILITSEC